MAVVVDVNFSIMSLHPSRLLILASFLHVASSDGSNIAITVDNILRALYIDGQKVDASKTPNANTWERADTVPLPNDASLVAVWGHDDGVVAGILASSTDDLFITSNTSWKCIPKNEATDHRWMQEDYDDSGWPSAAAVGGNPDLWHTPSVNSISSEAMWIWTDKYLWNGNEVDRDVMCRGRPEGQHTSKSPTGDTSVTTRVITAAVTTSSQLPHQFTDESETTSVDSTTVSSGQLSKLSQSTVIGVAVGVTVGAVLLLAAVIIVLAVLRRRRHFQNSNETTQKPTANIYQQLTSDLSQFGRSADDGSMSRDNPSTYERIHPASNGTHVTSSADSNIHVIGGKLTDGSVYNVEKSSATGEYDLTVIDNSLYEVENNAKFPTTSADDYETTVIDNSLYNINRNSNVPTVTTGDYDLTVIDNSLYH